MVVIHHGRIGSEYSRMRFPHSYGHILSMSVNGAAMIFSFASWVIYVPMSCRHPFIRYRQPLLAKMTVTCCLQHPDHEHQQSVNRYRSCIFCNEGIARILARITVFLTALIGKNTIYQRWNTNTKLIDLANSSTWKSTLLIAENAILIRYY